MKILAALMLAAILAGAAEAKIVTKTIEYKQADTVLEGYLAYDDTAAGPRPGVLIVHDWMGPRPFTKAKAEQLAGLGYVAFAADIYGKGVRPTTAEEAGKLAGMYKGDRPLLRARARAGFDLLRDHPNVDPKRIAAIGFCFGGTTALELARGGAPLAGTVSFHGGLSTPAPGDAKQITGKILALHGADDPSVPPEEVAGFENEMRAAGVDWQLIAYGGAVHAFTNPDAGSDPSRGAAYNAAADARSWKAMRQFFEEIFQ